MTLSLPESRTQGIVLENISSFNSPLFQTGKSRTSYAEPMSWDQRLRTRLSELGWIGTELGRRMGIDARSGSADMERLHKYIQGKVKNPRGDILGQIAKAVGMTERELRYGEREGLPRIPIIGAAGAAEHWMMLESDAAAPELLDLGLDTGEDFIAIEVRGESMSPVYRAGDMLIGAKTRGHDIAKLIGRDSILETVTGERLVKIVQKGSRLGRFRLRSYNPSFDDIEDVVLEWAAPIDFIKRKR